MEDNLSRLFWLLGTILISCQAVPLNDSKVQATIKNQTGSNICISKECNSTASKILKNMDSSIDPCDDFYLFTCGKFLKDAVIPEGKTSVNMFEEIVESIYPKIQKAVLNTKESDIRPFRLVKNLYDTCMDETLIEKKGRAELESLMTMLGGWPVLLGDKWNNATFNWTDIMIKHRKLGFDHNDFLELYISQDLKNNSQYTIHIDQAKLKLSGQFLLNGLKDKVVMAYLKYMVEIAVLLGADKHYASQELADSLQFETELARISLSMEDRRNISALYHPMTIQELNKKFPSVQWKKFINDFLAPIKRVSKKEVINVVVPTFIVDLLKLLEITPKRVQANYAMWGLIFNSVQFLSKDMRKTQLEYNSVRTGLTGDTLRWKQCISHINSHMPIAIGALYVRNFFPAEVKKNVEEMVADIRNVFQVILKKTEWMDPVTRERAIEKLTAMSAHIGYPDELMDDRKLERYHAGLTINQESYLQADLSLKIFELESTIKRLRKRINRTDWIDHSYPATVNALYSPDKNSIQFPAGILQGVFFNDKRPKYMNYGSMGSVIGHEIVHGFDDQGRTFDKVGKLADWWEPSTKSEFLLKAQCIIDQYSNYTDSDVKMHINGVNTQGENIADNGGVKGAYLAYNEWVKRNNVEPQLPGLNYTGHQMFWISIANVWCTKATPEDTRSLILTDTHSPENFRVIGSLSNSPEFSRDFGCPLGSNMNPYHKCSVW